MGFSVTGCCSGQYPDDDLRRHPPPLRRRDQPVAGEEEGDRKRSAEVHPHVAEISTRQISKASQC